MTGRKQTNQAIYTSDNTGGYAGQGGAVGNNRSILGHAVVMVGGGGGGGVGMGSSSMVLSSDTQINTPDGPVKLGGMAEMIDFIRYAIEADPKLSALYVGFKAKNRIMKGTKK